MVKEKDFKKFVKYDIDGTIFNVKRQFDESETVLDNLIAFLLNLYKEDFIESENDLDESK